jgi:hypothetical protein
VLERASGQFTIEGNVEDIFGGISGATRIARISQTCLFTGALQGESIAEYTAVLPRGGDGSFQGFQRISGALGEREGTFVVCVTGEYAKGQPRGSWTIVPKSGSGDFVHIRGSGTFSQSPGKAGNYKFEFDLRKPRKTRDAGAAAEPEATELIPGIDVVAEDELTPEIEPIAATPLDETPVEKPVRRPRKKAAPPEPEVVEPAALEPAVAPKRSRKKAAPVVVEAIAEPPVTAPAPSRKRSPKKEPLVVEVANTVAIEPTPKPRRTRGKAIAEPVAVEPAPAPATPRKRARKTTEVEIVESTAIAIESKPKPARRKKPVVPTPEPVPLPVALEKPARQRKANAA